MLNFKTMTFITSDFILPTSLQMTSFVVLSFCIKILDKVECIMSILMQLDNCN